MSSAIIIRVISKIKGPSFVGHLILFNTRTITDRIKLHSAVQLPLIISKLYFKLKVLRAKLLSCILEAFAYLYKECRPGAVIKGFFFVFWSQLDEA